LEKAKTQLKKIDVNTVDRMNRTPLHLAVAQGHNNVVWFLLANKARMDIYDTGGKTPFLKVIEKFQAASVLWFLKQSLGVE